MTLYLGIDGGGTGCRAILADGTGRILGTGSAGPANIRTDPDGSLENILAATTQAAQSSDVRLSSIHAVLGLAGANVSAAAKRLAALLPFARTRIVSDGLTTTRGALGRTDGVVAAIGTGSVFSAQIDGEIRQIGGHGFMLGDEGGGAALGRALLTETLHASERIIPMTPLLAGVLEDLGGHEAIIIWSFRASPAEYATLAPRIVGSTDPAARRVMARAAHEVAQYIDALQPADGPLPVVFLGGIGPAYGILLHDRWPQMAAQGTALDGALQLARELGDAA